LAGLPSFFSGVVGVAVFQAILRFPQGKNVVFAW
jgi:hypothetical protein